MSAGDRPVVESQNSKTKQCYQGDLLSIVLYGSGKNHPKYVNNRPIGDKSTKVNNCPIGEKLPKVSNCPIGKLAQSKQSPNLGKIAQSAKNRPK
jgi:hypothetical protein